MKPPVDQRQREIAARTFDRNVVVVAGAGSGKTTLLIERLLNMLLGRGLPLGAIMALTFTEKAAAEMRARLASQLSRALELLAGAERGTDPASFSLEFVMRPEKEGGHGLSADEVRRRALQALHDLDGASIGTIHAACADLLRRHPAASRLDPAFVVDDGTRTERLLEDEWMAFQAETLRPDASEAARWRRVLRVLDASSVRDMALKLLDAPVLPEDRGASRAQGLLRERAEPLLAGCEGVAATGASANCIGWAEILAGRLRATLDGGAEGLRAWELAHPPTWPSKSQPKPGKKCTEPELVTEVLSGARALTDDLLRCDDAACDDVLELAGNLARRARARLDAEGIVGFGELLSRARDVLLHEPDVRRAVQDRVQALLLDEFQDTDPLQYEIAFLLAEDPSSPVAPGGDPMSARLLPGRLFIVGDPKQSIYRFRGADMAAYARAVSLMAGQGATLVSLVANFRSSAAVLEPVNDLCDGLIREDLPWQPAYERLVATPRGEVAPLAELPAISLWSVRSQGGAADWRLAEGRSIAARVRSWRDVGAIRDYGSVVILLRAMTGAEPYMRALAEAGVPFVARGGKGFFRRPEIVQAITLLRCLVRPHDGASLLAVLRSASGGASDAEIRAFAQLTGKAWSLRSIERLDDAQRAEVPAVSRALLGLGSLARRVAELPADEAVRLAILGEGDEGSDASGEWRPNLVPLAAAGRNGAQRLANLQRLVERAESLAREGSSLPRVVQQLADELERAEPQGESPLADESVDAVRVMTVHQAKGLEFDVVILPDLAHEKKPGRRDPVSVESREGMLAVRVERMVNLPSVLLKEDALKHDAAEDRRILYVALTRAKHRLVLVNGCPKPRSNAVMFADVSAGWGWTPSVEGGGAALHRGVTHESLDPPPADDDDIAGDARAAEIGALAAAVLAQREGARRMGSARRARPRSPSGIAEERARELEARAFQAADAGVGVEDASARSAVSREASFVSAGPRDRSLAKAIGVTVHLALEAGALEAADGEIAGLAARAADVVASEGGASPELVAGEAERLLRGLAGSEIARQLRGARVLARELPFLMAAHEGADWQGFIDLVVEKDGETWVVDWKTDAEIRPERHAAQMSVYAEVVRRWRGLPRPPRIALAYVAKGRWVELDAPVA